MRLNSGPGRSFPQHHRTCPSPVASTGHAHRLLPAPDMPIARPENQPICPSLADRHRMCPSLAPATGHKCIMPIRRPGRRACPALGMNWSPKSWTENFSSDFQGAVQHHRWACPPGGGQVHGRTPRGTALRVGKVRNGRRCPPLRLLRHVPDDVLEKAVTPQPLAALPLLPGVGSLPPVGDVPPSGCRQ